MDNLVDKYSYEDKLSAHKIGNHHYLPAGIVLFFEFLLASGDILSVNQCHFKHDAHEYGEPNDAREVDLASKLWQYSDR